MAHLTKKKKRSRKASRMAHVKAVEYVPRVRKNKGPKKATPKVSSNEKKMIRVGFGQYRLVPK